MLNKNKHWDLLDQKTSLITHIPFLLNLVDKLANTFQHNSRFGHKIKILDLTCYLNYSLGPYEIRIIVVGHVIYWLPRLWLDITCNCYMMLPSCSHMLHSWVGSEHVYGYYRPPAWLKAHLWLELDL